MVDVPFVSEEFQRAFRNTFKGQVNSGRDLHVSDVVIPVVDFTPTASTTSIPFDLLTSRNRNTGGIAVTSTSASTDVTTQTGFFRLSTTFKASADSFINFFFDDGSVKMVVEFGEDYNNELSSGKYTTVKPAEKKAPTTYEDDFGQRRFLTGENEGKLVSEVPFNRTANLKP